MRAPMTDKQKEVFKFVEKFWSLEERCPSLREICEGKIRNVQEIPPRSAKNTAHFLVLKLVEKRYLVEDQHGGRTFWRVAS
jgi:hypothetical protein